MKSQGLGAIVVVAGLGGYHIFNETDKRVNYVPVEAEVTAAKSTCYLEHETKSHKRRSVNCSLARNRKTMRRMHREVVYQFNFKSPVDGSLQSGKGSTKFDMDEAYFKRGASIQLHAHAQVPSKYKTYNEPW